MGGAFYGKSRQHWKRMSLHLAKIHRLLRLASLWCKAPQCWHANLTEVKGRSDTTHKLEQMTPCLLDHFLIPSFALSFYAHTYTLEHMIKTLYFWGEWKWLRNEESLNCLDVSNPFFSSWSLSSPAALLGREKGTDRWGLTAMKWMEPADWVISKGVSGCGFGLWS